MPANLITDPAAYSTEAFSGAIFTQTFIATGTIAKGTVVQLVTGYTSTTAPIKVKAATTTENFLLLGVALKAAVTGGIVQVITSGIAKTLVHTATTKADVVLQTGTNAGYAKTTGTAVLGKTLGVCLETTAGTTAHSCWIYVSRM